MNVINRFHLKMSVLTPSRRPISFEMFGVRFGFRGRRVGRYQRLLVFFQFLLNICNNIWMLVGNVMMFSRISCKRFSHGCYKYINSSCVSRLSCKSFPRQPYRLGDTGRGEIGTCSEGSICFPSLN